jgi:type I restriction enzyme S subunit
VSKMAKNTLPNGWHWARFGDIIAESQPGFASGQRDPKGVIQLRMNNVDTRGNLVWDEFLRVPADKVTIEKFRLKLGDVVFNNTNSTELVGKSALFTEHDEPVVYSNHFTRLRVKPDLADPGFITFWLISQWQARTFENICNRWIGQSAVKSDKLFQLKIPIPPLTEQRRIAARLNEQMAAVAQARQSAEEQLLAARELPSAYLRDAIENLSLKNYPLDSTLKCNRWFQEYLKRS